jgi:ubiquinone/menaquinone biosynthesis C-methylase UbiE
MQYKMSTVQQFYNHLAENYDEAATSKKRFIKEKRFFNSVLKNHKISTALDAGAGTGFHSLLLASLGISVTAVDISNQMLSFLKRNIHKTGLEIKTVHSDFLSLSRRKDKYDLIVCMGNSLPHSSPSKRKIILKTFYRMLNPGGMIIIQTINYKNILDNKFNIQSIKTSNNKTMIRFYDSVNDKIYFNFILLTYSNNGVTRYKIDSIVHYPIKKNDYQGDLINAGFKNIRFYGDIAFNGFDEKLSNDIIVLAEKNI